MTSMIPPANPMATICKELSVLVVEEEPECASLKWTGVKRQAYIMALDKYLEGGDPRETDIIALVLTNSPDGWI